MSLKCWSNGIQNLFCKVWFLNNFWNTYINNRYKISWVSYKIWKKYCARDLKLFKFKSKITMCKWFHSYKLNWNVFQYFCWYLFDNLLLLLFFYFKEKDCAHKCTYNSIIRNVYRYWDISSLFIISHTNFFCLTFFY